jgi:hypothetical protein
MMFNAGDRTYNPEQIAVMGSAFESAFRPRRARPVPLSKLALRTLASCSPPECAIGREPDGAIRI